MDCNSFVFAFVDSVFSAVRVCVNNIICCIVHTWAYKIHVLCRRWCDTHTHTQKKGNAPSSSHHLFRKGMSFLKSFKHISFLSISLMCMVTLRTVRRRWINVLPYIRLRFAKHLFRTAPLPRRIPHLYHAAPACTDVLLPAMTSLPYIPLPLRVCHNTSKK